MHSPVRDLNSTGRSRPKIRKKTRNRPSHAGVWSTGIFKAILLFYHNLEIMRKPNEREPITWSYMWSFRGEMPLDGHYKECGSTVSDGSGSKTSKWKTHRIPLLWSRVTMCDPCLCHARCLAYRGRATVKCRMDKTTCYVTVAISPTKCWSLARIWEPK